MYDSAATGLQAAEYARRIEVVERLLFACTETGGQASMQRLRGLLTCEAPYYLLWDEAALRAAAEEPGPTD